jgi:hypothetical protein
MMTEAAILSREGRRWGGRDGDGDDGEEEVVEMDDNQDRRGVGRWRQAKGNR